MKMRGFTLVEMMISVAIFSIVMTIALGALLAMSESDRKAQTLKSVINNLNFAMDSMSRSIRTGTVYHCGGGNYNNAADCSGTPDSTLAFIPAGVASSRTVYQRSVDSTLCGQSNGCIVRSTQDGANGTFSAITSSEVSINSLSFYVSGATVSTLQPKVTILISGTVNVSAGKSTPFNLQTTVTQRLYDQEQ